jgi:hypothetical protein
MANGFVWQKCVLTLGDIRFSKIERGGAWGPPRPTSITGGARPRAVRLRKWASGKEIFSAGDVIGIEHGIQERSANRLAARPRAAIADRSKFPDEYPRRGWAPLTGRAFPSRLSLGRRVMQPCPTGWSV